MKKCKKKFNTLDSKMLRCNMISTKLSNLQIRIRLQYKCKKWCQLKTNDCHLFNDDGRLFIMNSQGLMLDTPKVVHGHLFISKNLFLFKYT